jgi:hypothetical protein
MTLVMPALAHLVPRLAPKLGMAWLLLGGLATALVGAVWISRISERTHYFPQVAVPLVLLGIGVGIATIPTVFIGASASTARHLPVATTAPLAAKVELAHGTAMAVTGSAALLALALVVVALVIPRSAAPTGPRASALP